MILVTRARASDVVGAPFLSRSNSSRRSFSAVRFHPLPALLLVLSSHLLAQAPADSISITNPSPRDLAEGRRVFENQCVRCHGVDGTGGVGPVLAQSKLHRAPDDSTLVNVIQNGLPGTAMIGFWNLSDEETRQVAAYIRSIGRRPPEVLPGDPAHGQELYQRKGNCNSCHILDGQGAGWAPDLSQAGLRLSAVGLRQALVDPGAAQPVMPLPSVHGPYPAFLAVEATTRNGEIVTGTRVSEDDFTLIVRQTDGRLRSLDKLALRRLRKFHGRSPMPSFASVFTAEELDDLVAFLASRRGKP